MVESKVAENLVGVLKSLVRDEIRTQHKTAEEMHQDRVGAPWSANEEGQLVKEFNAATSVLAVLHQRTVGGVKSRLAILAKRGELFA